LSLGLFPGLGEGSWSGIGSNLAPVSGVNTCPELTGACGLKNAGAVDPALLGETSLDCTISFSDCMENGSTSGDCSSLSGNELRFAWLCARLSSSIMQNLYMVINEYAIARRRVVRATRQAKYRKFLAKGALAFKCEEVKLLQHIRVHATR
jgi:hypothetical protein